MYDPVLMAGTIRTVGVIIAGVVTLLAPGPALASGGGPISVLSQGETVVEAQGGKDVADAHLTLLNSGAVPMPIGVSFQAGSINGIVVRSSAPSSLPAHAATRLTVMLAGLSPVDKKASGQLVIKSDPTLLATPISITPGLHAAADWGTVVPAASVGLMVLIALAILVRTRKKPEWRSAFGGRAPGPKWTFSSWASTFTAAGAVLGTVLGAVTVPGGKQIDKETLVRLNVLFGGLTVVAPFIFQAIRSRTVLAGEQDAGLWGFNWSLLLACSITAGAVLGELGTLELLAWEAIGEGVVAWLAIAALAVLQLVAARYFLITTWSLVTTDWGKAAQDDKRNIAATREALHGIAVATMGDAAPAVEAVLAAPVQHNWSLP
jgi:hypothetical protein